LDARDFHLCPQNPYGLQEWRGILAARFGVPEERVVPVAGASAAIFAVCALLLRPGDVVLAETPCYEALRRVPAFFGARVRPLPRREESAFSLAPAMLGAIETSRPRLVMVSDLHNPTGAPLSHDEQDRLVAAVEARDSYLFCDEVYREFLPAPPPPLALVSPRVISAGSLTKAYGLGPLRAGWLVASAPMAEDLRRVIDLAYVENAGIAEAIAARIIPRLDRLRDRATALLTPRRAVLDAWLLSRSDLRVYRNPVVPFSFPRLTRGIPGRSVSEVALARHGVAVVPGDFFGAPQHVRISCAGLPPERLDEALARLGRVLDSLPPG
jgi:aspartate/methionine/tyrosine aminotransferase